MTKQELLAGKERYRKDYGQYIQEGWIREIYDAGWGMFCAVSESSYVVFVYGAIDATKDLTALFLLKGEEIFKLLEDPSLDNFKWLNYATQQQKENRAYTIDPPLAAKLRELYHSWGPDRPPEIDRARESARLAEIAKKRDSFRGRFARSARKTLAELFGS